MEISDSTGQFKCLSQVNPFLVQEGALRSDYGAEITIPAEKLPAELSDGFTMSIWSSQLPTILAQDRIPIISKGNLWLESDFAFVLNGQMPIFTFKSGNEHFQGIDTIGMSYGDSFRYADPSITVHTKGSLRLPTNKWINLSITYDGKSLKFYKDGDLFIEKTMPEMKRISLTGDRPIYLASDRLGKEFYTASNMLLNDVRLYRGVLTPEELKKQYEADRPSYPDGASYSPTTHYYPGTSYEGFDPDLKNILKRTDLYEKEVRPALKNEKVSRASTEFRNGRMNFNINGKSIYPLSGYPGMGWFGKQAVDQSAEYIRDFAAAGVDLDIAGGGNISKYWLGENSYDWSLVDAGFTSILKSNPKLKLFVVVPCFLPEWFTKAHPEELEKYYSTRDSKAPLTAWTDSLIASELWQNTLDIYLDAAIKHYENSAYGDNIAGYLIVGGDAGEFYWPGTFTGGATGYSDNTLKEFRKWLAVKYKNDTALQAAWGKKELVRSTATVPTPEERFSQSENLFRDFRSARNAIDFREFLGDTTLSAIKRILSSVKSASKGERVLMLYGGYPILFAGKGHTLQQSGMQTTAGLMQEKNLSVLSTPIDYVSRRGGEPGININPYNGSARLHKKMLFNENDLRTHFYTMNTFGRTANLEESIGVIKRGIGHTIIRGEG
ncbi:MAG: beta-galactosidase, partial [Lentisphaerae bacterium]|nr:beta-galactosidase [Lentisphaerota bacterium]